MQIAKNINDEFISIDSNTSGQYYCIDCGSELINKNKKIIDRKNEIHFAHKTTCSGNLETYLHKVAKQIIKEEKYIVLPERDKVYYKETILEERLNDIVPDALIIENNGKKTIIEIYVTHLTDDAKISKIEEIGIDAFEIDLSGLNYESSKEEIRYEVIENIDNRTPLFDIDITNNEIEKTPKNISSSDDNGFLIFIGGAFIAIVVWLFWKPIKSVFKSLF